MTALNHEQIIRVIGQQTASAHQITEMIETGATEEQLIEAYERVSQNSVGVETRRPPGDIVNRLIEILTADDPQWDED
ncbi:MAG: hypothetical protein ACE363_03940 [Alphaproteobacteria bacterium]